MSAHSMGAHGIAVKRYRFLIYSPYKGFIMTLHHYPIRYWNTLSIPEWAVCAIEYGDYSGLSDHDIALIEGFFEEFPCDRFTIQWGNDRFFSNSPAFGLPSTCIDAEFFELQKPKA